MADRDDGRENRAHLPAEPTGVAVAWPPGLVREKISTDAVELAAWLFDVEEGGES